MKINDFEMVAQFSNDEGEVLRIKENDHIKVITDKTDFPAIIIGDVESVDENGTISFASIDNDKVAEKMPNYDVPMEYIKEIKVIG